MYDIMCRYNAYTVYIYDIPYSSQDIILQKTSKTSQGLNIREIKKLIKILNNKYNF